MYYSNNQVKQIFPPLCKLLIQLSIISFLVFIDIFADNETVKIHLNITGSFPINEPIKPEVITLDGLDIYKNSFKPGKHQLKIQHKAYISVFKNIVIPSDSEKYLIKEILIAKARKIELDITYYVKPDPNLTPHKVTLTLINNPKWKEITSGIFIQPNTYYLKITKPAYSTYEKKIHIWPDNKPLLIKEILLPKGRDLKLGIIYDVKPCKYLQPSQVTLICKPRNILHIGHFPVYPGLYLFEIYKPGYQNFHKEINILPSKKVYSLRAYLIAKKRKISFFVSNKNAKIKKFGTFNSKGIYQFQKEESIEVLSMYNLDKNTTINKDNTFQPGKKYHLKLKFKKHKTIDTIVQIMPGEDGYVLQLHLENKE